jgi:hypothetical protein
MKLAAAILNGAACQRRNEMPITGAETMRSRLERNDEVRGEIQGFLRAMDSYPARFAIDPGLSFEEHCKRVMASRTGRILPASETAYRLAGGTMPFIRR